MGATLKWSLHRVLHRKWTWVLLLVLTGCSILLGGGIQRHWSADFDINLLNLSYAVDFDSMEDFLDWYHPFQYQWLVSASGMVTLLPVLVSLFPAYASQEATVPVIMGRTRSQIFFSGLICYYAEAALLWLCCFLLGFLLSAIPFAPAFSLAYYLRTLGLALWLFLGFAGLSLAVALLPKNRFAGLVASFFFMAALSVSRNNGFWRGTVLSDIFYPNGRRTELWMWAEHGSPSAMELLVVILFPLVTTLLACGVGLWKFHRRDLS